MELVSEQTHFCEGRNTNKGAQVGITFKIASEVHIELFE